MREAAVRAELRWLADLYEQTQRIRIEVGERIRAVLQGRDQAGADGAGDTRPRAAVTAALAAIRAGRDAGPVPLLGRTYRLHWEHERELRAGMAEALGAHPAWPWLSSLPGMGPTLAARLLGRLDIARAATPSAFWAYCGLATVPAVELACHACGTVTLQAHGRARPHRHRSPGGRLCTAPLETLSVGVRRVAQPRPAVGERAGYDRHAKRTCYLVALSFLRTGGWYAAHYRTERARLQRARPDWSAGHAHLAALRKLEKLFLSHLWIVWAEAAGRAVTTPYAVAQLDRATYLPPRAGAARNRAVLQP